MPQGTDADAARGRALAAAARQVGKILKYVGEHDPMQAHYSFYM
jgi:hypothetical protein